MSCNRCRVGAFLLQHECMLYIQSHLTSQPWIILYTININFYPLLCISIGVWIPSCPIYHLMWSLIDLCSILFTDYSIQSDYPCHRPCIGISHKKNQNRFSQWFKIFHSYYLLFLYHPYCGGYYHLCSIRYKFNCHSVDICCFHGGLHGLRIYLYSKGELHLNRGQDNCYYCYGVTYGVGGGAEGVWGHASSGKLEI